MLSCFNKNCCICYSNNLKNIECIHCKEGIICSTCLISLVENGKANICPVCRREDWRTTNKRKAILPEFDNTKNTDNNLESQNNDN